MTRAMFITVIGRLYQELSGNAVIASGANEFTDCPIRQLLYSVPLIGPMITTLSKVMVTAALVLSDNVTRAQMAQIIANFVQYMGTRYRCL